jgi:hypothetical protein
VEKDELDKRFNEALDRTKKIVEKFDKERYNVPFIPDNLPTRATKGIFQLLFQSKMMTTTMPTNRETLKVFPLIVYFRSCPSI